MDFLNFRLSSAEEECRGNNQCNAGDNEKDRGGFRRRQGIYVKIEKNRRNLHRKLLYRDDVAGLSESEGLIGLPDAENVAANQDDAGQNEKTRLRPGTVAGQDYSEHGQQRADPEIREREREPVGKSHDDSLPSGASERYQVSKAP